MEVATEAKKGNGKIQARVIMPQRFAEAETLRHDWIADAEVGTSLEEVMEPSYWTHVAPLMVPYDHIEVRAEDGTWIAYLVVLYAERNYAKVVLDRVLKVEQNAEVPEASLKHKVKYNGPHHKFCVIRLSDDEILHKGCKTREEADAWLRTYEKSMER